MLKWLIFLLFAFVSCTIVVKRSHGLREPLFYKKILDIDTVWNKYGGVEKIVTVKMRKKDVNRGE